MSDNADLAAEGGELNVQALDEGGGHDDNSGEQAAVSPKAYRSESGHNGSGLDHDVYQKGRRLRDHAFVDIIFKILESAFTGPYRDVEL